MSERRVVRIGVLAGIALLAGLGLLLRLELNPRARYELTFVPDVNGYCLGGSAINDLGQVVGGMQVQPDRWRIFLWDPNSGMRDLGRYPDPLRLGGLRMNDAGQIAGEATDPNGNAYAFLQDPDGLRHILRPPLGEQIEIEDLNHRGQIVGNHYRSTGPWRGFVWDKTTGMQDVAILNAAQSTATGINDRGQIVGSYAANPAGQWRVFLWDPNTGVHDIGPATRSVTRMCFINNQGFVAGRFSAHGDESALTVWTRDEGARPVCPAKGVPVQIDGLNDAGSFVACTHEKRFMIRQFSLLMHIDSYVWDPDEGFAEIGARLGRTDVIEFFATDINDKGQILGYLRLRKKPNPILVVLTPMKAHKGAG